MPPDKLTLEAALYKDDPFHWSVYMFMKHAALQPTTDELTQAKAAAWALMPADIQEKIRVIRNLDRPGK